MNSEKMLWNRREIFGSISKPCCTMFPKQIFHLKQKNTILLKCSIDFGNKMTKKKLFFIHRIVLGLETK